MAALMAGPDGLLAVALGYFSGSVPFGLILTRMLSGLDLRTVGSGNIGATNVLRTGNRLLALATLILDAGKGMAAVIVAGLVWSPALGAAAGLAAVIGHCFPVWLRFSGGKGVATGMAVIAALSPTAGLIMAIVWLAVAFLVRYSSLAALVSYLSATLYGLFFLSSDDPRLAAIAAIALLSWLRHYQNIKRLIRGEESRISLSKAK